MNQPFNLSEMEGRIDGLIARLYSATSQLEFIESEEPTMERQGAVSNPSLRGKAAANERAAAMTQIRQVVAELQDCARILEACLGDLKQNLVVLQGGSSRMNLENTKPYYTLAQSAANRDIDHCEQLLHKVRDALAHAADATSTRTHETPMANVGSGWSVAAKTGAGASGGQRVDTVIAETINRLTLTRSGPSNQLPPPLLGALGPQRPGNLSEKVALGQRKAPPASQPRPPVAPAPWEQLLVQGILSGNPGLGRYPVPPPGLRRRDR